MGYSDLEGNNAKLRLKGNQEMSKAELIERQNQMNELIMKNKNAVEDAIREHDHAFEIIQEEMKPSFEENASE